jgi:hypothetical protein
VPAIPLSGFAADGDRREHEHVAERMLATRVRCGAGRSRQGKNMLCCRASIMRSSTLVTATSAPPFILHLYFARHGFVHEKMTLSVFCPQDISINGKASKQAAFPQEIHSHVR